MPPSTPLTRLSFSVSCCALLVAASLLGCEAPIEEGATLETGHHGLSPDGDKSPLECGTKVLNEDQCAAEDYWVSRAEQKCQSRGWKLSQYSLLSKCKEGGKYGSSDIKFECCGAPGSSQPEWIKPDVVKDTAACFSDHVASKSCRAPKALISDADSVCGDNGLDVAQYALGQPCETKGKKGFMSIKFECCAAALETAQDIEDLQQIDTIEVAGCWEAALGSSETCSTAGALEEKASAACANSNQTLTQVGFGQSCKAGKEKGFRFAKFQCCDEPELDSEAGEEPQGIEEAEVCKAASIGGLSVCLPELHFASKAKGICGDNGLELTQYAVSTPCKTEKGAGYRFAKFECCEAPSGDLQDSEKPVDSTKPADAEKPAENDDSSPKPQPKTT